MKFSKLVRKIIPPSWFDKTYSETINDLADKKEEAEGNSKKPRKWIECISHIRPSAWAWRNTETGEIVEKDSAGRYFDIFDEKTGSNSLDVRANDPQFKDHPDVMGPGDEKLGYGTRYNCVTVLNPEKIHQELQSSVVASFNKHRVT